MNGQQPKLWLNFSRSMKAYCLLNTKTQLLFKLLHGMMMNCIRKVTVKLPNQICWSIQSIVRLGLSSLASANTPPIFQKARMQKKQLPRLTRYYWRMDSVQLYFWMKRQRKKQSKRYETTTFLYILNFSNFELNFAQWCFTALFVVFNWSEIVGTWQSDCLFLLSVANWSRWNLFTPIWCFFVQSQFNRDSDRFSQKLCQIDSGQAFVVCFGCIHLEKFSHSIYHSSKPTNTSKIKFGCKR